MGTVWWLAHGENHGRGDQGLVQESGKKPRSLSSRPALLSGRAQQRPGRRTH